MNKPDDVSRPAHDRAHHSEEQRVLPAGEGDYQLAALKGKKPPAPAWFERAMAQQPRRTMLDVGGKDIEVLDWGTAGKPGLLLIHGSRASADWWTAIAPLLMHDFHVTAFSLSGMGGSGRREAYSIRQYGLEAYEVAQATGLFDGPVRPVIAAHSFGGYTALQAAHDHPEAFGGLILVDVILREFDEGIKGRRARLAAEPVRIYDSEEQALSRFRLIPARQVESLWALDAIARAGVCHDQELGGWTWRFDPKLFARLETEDHTELMQVTAPVAMIRGEESPLVDPYLRELVARVFGSDIPDVVIPDAGHHIMADQPLALATALRTLLSVWPEGGRRSVLGRNEPSPY